MSSIVGSNGITTALQTVGVPVEMDDAIVLLNIDDVPLQRRLASEPCHETRIDWLEDSYVPDTFTVATSGVSGTQSPWTLTVDDTSWVRVNDVFVIKGRAYNLQFLVSSITNGTTVVVTGFGSTGASDDPIDADVFQLIGQLPHEGADPDTMRAVDRTNPYNYTQIAQEGVKVSRTQRKRQLYGVADEYTYQLQKKFRELAIRMERAMHSGVRYQSGDQRFMGGLLSYITTNATSDVKANALTAITSLVRKTFEAGGTPRNLYVSPACKVAISQNINASRFVQRTDTVGGQVIDSIITDFGEINLILDRHLPVTKALLLQEEFDKRRVFDGYAAEMLAKTGDGDKGEIVGEFSLEVKNQNAQGVLTLTDAT